MSCVRRCVRSSQSGPRAGPRGQRSVCRARPGRHHQKRFESDLADDEVSRWSIDQIETTRGRFRDGPETGMDRARDRRQRVRSRLPRLRWPARCRASTRPRAGDLRAGGGIVRGFCGGARHCLRHAGGRPAHVGRSQKRICHQDREFGRVVRPAGRSNGKRVRFDSIRLARRTSGSLSDSRPGGWQETPCDRLDYGRRQQFHW